MTTAEASTTIERYTAERQAIGHFNEATATTTRQRLLGFAEHFGSELHTVARTDVKAWLASLDVKSSTLNGYLSTLSSFYRWMNEEELMSHDPTIGIRRPKIPKAENRSLTDEEVARLYKTLPDRRAALIFSLMLGEGLRVAEVAAVQSHDIDHTRGVIHVRGKGHQGNRSRTIPLTTETIKAIRQYRLRHNHTTGPLIRSQSHGHQGVSANHLSHCVSDWMRGAGLKDGAYDGVSAHALRHTAAEQLAELTDDVRHVQALLGHENFATTQTYMRRDVKGLGLLQGLRGLKVGDGSTEDAGTLSSVADGQVAAVAEETPHPA